MARNAQNRGLTRREAALVREAVKRTRREALAHRITVRAFGRDVMSATLAQIRLAHVVEGRPDPAGETILTASTVLPGGDVLHNPAISSAK